MSIVIGALDGPMSRDIRTEDESDRDRRLGDLLAGRLDDVDVDSVEAVREVRDRELE